MTAPVLAPPRILRRGADPESGDRSQKNRRRAHAGYPSWMLWPAFAALATFFLVPTLLNFVYAFTNWSAFNDEISFVGLDNFSRLFADGSLTTSLRITLIWAILVAVLQNLFGFGLALLLERDSRVNRGARIAFFVPVLVSPLAIGYIFRAMLQPDGALNSFLSTVLGTDITTAWLGSTTWTIVVVSIVQAWKWMGLSMLIFLAGLKTMPTDVLEAARIDGAGWWKTLWKVRFPLLAPAITFNVATALLGSMNGFDTVQALTLGGPARTTELLNIFIYRTFGQGLYAQATTMSLVLFLTVVIVALPVIMFLRNREKAVQ